MTEFDHVALDSVLQLIHKAENDSEKCAALLVVAKLLKAETCSEEQRSEIYQAIGFSFPLRMISLQEGSEENAIMLINLGVSIFSAFATDKVISKSFEILEAVPHLLKIFENLSLKQMESQTLYECLQILNSVTVNEQGCARILNSFGVKILCNYYANTNNNDVRNLAYQIMLRLFCHNPTALWNEKNKVYILLVLNRMTEDILSDKSRTKFYLISCLTDLLSSLPQQSSDEYFDYPWRKNILKSIFEVLTSRITSREREPMLLLCEILFRHFGLKWMVINGQIIQQHLILPRLASIEISIIIQEHFDKEKLPDIRTIHKLSVLIACFGILESVCSDIAQFDQTENGPSFYTFNNIKCLDPSLSDTAESVFKLLKKIKENLEYEDLMLASLRFLGAWLNVQKFAASKVGIDMVESFLEAFSKSLKSSGKLKVSICIPAIMNFIEIPEVYDLIITSQIVEELCEYVAKDNSDVNNTLLISQCILSFVIISKDCSQLLKFMPLLSQATMQKQSPEEITVKITLSIIILILWNRLNMTIEQFDNFTDFYKSTISLLCGLHVTTNADIKLADRYIHDNQGVEQLFPIFLRELSKAIASDRTLINYTKKSELYSKVKMLVKHSSSSASCFQAYSAMWLIFLKM